MFSECGNSQLLRFYRALNRTDFIAKSTEVHVAVQANEGALMKLALKSSRLEIIQTSWISRIRLVIAIKNDPKVRLYFNYCVKGEENVDDGRKVQYASRPTLMTRVQSRPLAKAGSQGCT